MVSDESPDRFAGSEVTARHHEERNNAGERNASPRLRNQVYDSFLATNPRDPNPTSAINPAPNNHTAAGKGTSDVKAPCTLVPTPPKSKRNSERANEDRLGGA